MRLTHKVGGGGELGAVEGADPRKQAVMKLMKCLGQTCMSDEHSGYKAENRE